MTSWCEKETAVQIVESGNRVFVQGACATPTPLLEALVARGEELHNVELTHLHTYGPTPYTDEHWRGHFSLRALFVGENTREAVNAGRASYVPVFLSDIPMLFAIEGALPINVAFVQVSPPDTHGYCSLGSSVDVTRAAVDNAEHSVALVNPHMPRTHGDSFLRISQIDCAVNWDGPLYEVESRKPSETQLQIGRNVAGLIEDGATLQLGIGAIPDAVLRALSDRRDLGIHTEMFSDGILDLIERGVINGARKTIDRGKIVASFVVGSRTLLDFMRGAAQSKRGRPIIALPATAKAPDDGKTDTSNGMLAPVSGEISRIVPLLASGAAVTTSRAHVHYVVTEYGVAALHGRTLAERTHSLIEIAAPQFRENLERAAYELHLIR